MDEYIHRYSGQQIDDAVEAVINGNVGGEGGETGEDGGYYIPSVVQTDEYTARFSFTPSKNEMGEVADVDVDLPPGADGEPGKSAYQYAQDGGYTGTEAEFGEKLAEEMPTALPNPNAITINGISYNGSKAVNMTDTINGMIDFKLGVIENGSY